MKQTSSEIERTGTNLIFMHYWQGGDRSKQWVSFVFDGSRTLQAFLIASEQIPLHTRGRGFREFRTNAFSFVLSSLPWGGSVECFKHLLKHLLLFTCCFSIAVSQLCFAIVFCNFVSNCVLQLCIAIVSCNCVFQLCVATLFCKSALQSCVVIVFCTCVLQLCFTIVATTIAKPKKS